MKSIVTLITFCALWINVCAQAPQAFKYQAVARDNSGNILVEKSVKFKISIIQNTIDGEVVYSELHAKTTNSFGLVDMEIGNGTSPLGTFSAIKWGTDQFFIKVEIDPTGGTTYQTMGISQMLSVPYALYSLSSGDTCKWSSNQEKLFYNMGNVGIGTNTPSVDLEIFSTPGKAIRGMALNQYSDDRNGQMLLLRKWRGNSIDPLSLLNNDYTGALVFTGFNGTTPSITTPIGTAIIGGRINGTPSSSSLPQDLFFATSNTSTNNDPYLMNTVRMVISSTGNVGIGTINPQQKLHVNDVMRLEPRSAAPTSPSQGDIYFDNTLNKLRVYDGTQWQECW